MEERGQSAFIKGVNCKSRLNSELRFKINELVDQANMICFIVISNGTFITGDLYITFDTANNLTLNPSQSSDSPSLYSR